MSLIEFCGLPGSGKTTVNALLIERLRESGAKVVDRQSADREIESRYVGAVPVSTAAEAVRYGFSQPSWRRAALGVLRRSPSRRTVRSVIRIQNQLRVSLALGAAQQIVLDEWFVHEAWLASAESRRVRVPDVQPLLREVSAELATIPRLLVRFTVSPTIAAARVVARSQKTWFQRLSTNDLVELFYEANAGLDLLCRTSCEGSTRLVVIDTTNKTPTDIVERLLPTIRVFR